MANAVLIAVLGLALILFGLQDFFRAENRQTASRVSRATTLMVIGLYMLYLYQEMGSSSGSSGLPMMSSGGVYGPP